MKSIRSALLARLTAGGFILLGAAGTVLHVMVSRALKQEFDSGLLLSAQSLRAFVEEKEGGVKMDADVDDILEFSRPGAESVFMLTTPEGRELKRSRSLGAETLVVPGGVEESKPLAFHERLAGGRSLRGIALRFHATLDDPPKPGAKAPEAILVVARDDHRLGETLERLRNALLATGAGSLCCLALFLAWGVRRGLRPLDELSRGISAVDAKSLSSRFPENGLPLELQPIARRLNQLLERLEKVFQREKRFTADVAHELRTPLAELLALSEVNLLAPSSSEQDQAAAWQDAAAITRRMESLALRLLELARVEQDQWRLEAQTFSLRPLLETVWSRYAEAAIARGIAFENDISSSLQFTTDPVLFEAVLSNVIGNAVQHASAGSVFLISGDATALRFTNQVEGLEENDLPLLFERFWKKDSSRRDARRHGLGLSLTREMVKLLGGTLNARLHAADRLEFTLKLP